MKPEHEIECTRTKKVIQSPQQAIYLAKTASTGTPRYKDIRPGTTKSAITPEGDDTRGHNQKKKLNNFNLKINLFS